MSKKTVVDLNEMKALANDFYATRSYDKTGDWKLLDVEDEDAISTEVIRGWKVAQG